jgi:hypothetical protein
MEQLWTSKRHHVPAVTSVGWRIKATLKTTYGETAKTKTFHPKRLKLRQQPNRGERHLSDWGSVNLLKQLIAGGFPIMIELGYAPEGNDWLGTLSNAGGL